MELGGRFAATLRRPPRVDLLELGSLLGIGVVALVLALGAAETPSTLLALAATGATIAVIVARIDLAILLVVATAPLESAFAAGPAGISVTKITGGLCFASFAFAVLRRHLPLVLERGQALVLGILALALVSSLQARELSAALTTTTRYASFAAVYVIITQFGHDRLLQRRIAWVVAVTAGISAYLGLNEYFANGSALATLKHANPNDFAFILATSLPLMFWLLGSRPALRPFVLALVGLVFAAILLSLSRGALVGLGAGLVFLLLTDRRRLQLTLIAGGLATLTAILVIHSDPARFQNALLLKERVAQQNVNTRYEVWGAAARLAVDHPLLGVGPGNFQFYYNELTGRPVGTFALTVAHNAFLDVSTELGLPAMILLVLFLTLTFARLTTAVREGYGEPGYAQALRISLVVAVVSALFLSEQYFLPFWLIGGLATAIWVDGRRRRAAADEPAAAA
jgi:putative inorganic carbon (HCO3(-)) transporter